MSSEKQTTSDEKKSAKIVTTSLESKSLKSMRVQKNFAIVEAANELNEEISQVEILRHWLKELFNKNNLRKLTKMLSAKLDETSKAFDNIHVKTRKENLVKLTKLIDWLNHYLNSLNSFVRHIRSLKTLIDFDDRWTILSNRVNNSILTTSWSKLKDLVDAARLFNVRNDRKNIEMIKKWFVTRIYEMLDNSVNYLNRLNRFDYFLKLDKVATIFHRYASSLLMLMSNDHKIKWVLFDSNTASRHRWFVKDSKVMFFIWIERWRTFSQSVSMLHDCRRDWTKSFEFSRCEMRSFTSCVWLVEIKFTSSSSSKISCALTTKSRSLLSTSQSSISMMTTSRNWRAKMRSIDKTSKMQWWRERCRQMWWSRSMWRTSSMSKKNSMFERKSNVKEEFDENEQDLEESAFDEKRA